MSHGIQTERCCRIRNKVVNETDLIDPVENNERKLCFSITSKRLVQKTRLLLSLFRRSDHSFVVLVDEIQSIIELRKLQQISQFLPFQA